MQKKAAIFILLSILGVMGLDLLYGIAIHRNDFNKVWWLEHKTHQNYDFIFLGNSRVYTMLQTDTLEKAWHEKGLNISLDGADLSQQYMMLYIFLKNGNKTGRLYMNIDFTELALPMDNELRVWCFLPYMDQEIYTVLKANYGNHALLWRYIPFYRYAEYNSKIGLLTVVNGVFNVERRPFNDLGDFTGLPNHRFNLSDTFGPRNIIPCEKDVYYFEKILMLCNQNRISIQLYTAPVYKSAAVKWINHNEVISGCIMPLAERYNAGYHDYTDIPLSSNSQYFIDVTHLNSEGRSKWMKYIIGLK